MATKTIIARKMAHSFSESIPRLWANDNVVITHFYNALSTVIPRGERFFISTVRRASVGINNPQLLADVSNFITQECHHRVGHNAMNESLKNQDYPVLKAEQSVHRLLLWIEQHCTLKYQLALTVALEHFSSLLSDRFLRSKHLQQSLHPEMRDFLITHCMEEIEHKAVAFDVYQTVYGGYFARVLMMIFVALVFAPNVFRIQFMYLKQDNARAHLPSWCKAITYFWFKPGWFAHTVPGFLSFFHPRFHPWKYDNMPLVRAYDASQNTLMNSAVA